MTIDQKVQEWISNHFEMKEISIQLFPALPAGRMVTDNKGDTKIVFYDLMCDKVDVMTTDGYTYNCKMY